MFIYFTTFSVIVFSAIISAVVGFLVYQAGGRFLPSSVIRHIVGGGTTVLTGCFITTLLHLEIWYVYTAVIVSAVIIYTVSIVSSSK
ncbi:hypothetical protein [Sporosarcina obsidiansis]|uniref:hypothetical protein n=1 Tax=Sporosarcina obsidiansis TaxID=2660748 RepID=UPI00129A4BA0|nr:hypothetical protein [Sporosarcina obsidiansis]